MTVKELIDRLNGCHEHDKVKILFHNGRNHNIGNVIEIYIVTKIKLGHIILIADIDE